MTIRIERYAPAWRSQWNETVANAKNGTFLFDRAFMEYHADRFEDHSLTAWRDDRLIAVLPANIAGRLLVSHGGLTFGGWITGPDMRAAVMLEVFQAMAEYARAVAGAERIVYKCVPTIYHAQPAQDDQYALFRMGATLIRRDLATAIEPANRLPMSETRRQTVAKARKQGVTVQESGDLAQFHQLLSEVLARHGTTPVHSLTELERLTASFPRNIRLFAAHQSGEHLAGALIFDNGRVAHTQYLANSGHGRKIGALDAIIETLLAEVFADRRWFSFGASTEDEGRTLNEGLLAQKESFGGRSVVHDFYELRL